MALNRSCFVDRDFEGDAEFAEALSDHIATLRAFGGELYVSAARDKFDRDGNRVEHSDPRGKFLTYGFVIAYSSKSQLKGTPEEPEERYGAVTPPEPASENGALEPEPEPQEA